MQNLEKALAAKVWPRLGGAAPFVSMLSPLFVSLALNYFIFTFKALSFDAGVAVWAAFMFIGHIVVLSSLVLLELVPGLPKAAAPGKKTA